MLLFSLRELYENALDDAWLNAPAACLKAPK
jgi:hypothetical protein